MASLRKTMRIIAVFAGLALLFGVAGAFLSINLLANPDTDAVNELLLPLYAGAFVGILTSLPLSVILYSYLSRKFPI